MHSARQRGNARAAVLRRREPLPGDSGRMGGQVASRPSRPLLPPAPPTVSCVPASRELVSGGPHPLPLRGGAQAPGSVSLLRSTAAAALYCGFSVAPPYLPLQMERRNVAGGRRMPGPQTRGAHGVDYQFISTTDGCILSTRQLIYRIDFERLSRHDVTKRCSTCNTLATLTGKWHSVHSMCQRGKHFGKNGTKPCRVDTESSLCALCLSTRQ